MSLMPFTDRAKKIAKAIGYKAMQERSDYARSDSWWNNLVNHGPWKGSGESRVFPPSVETIPGIAKLFESTEAEVRAMIAADWYALAACWAGDTLVVTKLDRLARSVRDAHEIADDLANREIKLSIGGSVHDPVDPMGKLLFNVLAMISEFEADLIRMRTREGMKVAKAKGRLRGKQPKLTVKQENHLLELHAAGEHSKAELAELFSVGRSAVYRAIERGQRRRPN